MANTRVANGQTVNLLSFDFGGSNPSLPTKNCGSSSVDRALAFQAEGRGFEPRLPLYRRDDLIISSFILHRPFFSLLNNVPNFSTSNLLYQ